MRPNTLEMAEQLRNCRWFHAVGQPINDAGAVTVASWDDALDRDDSDQWGTTCLAAANELRRAVQAKDVECYRLWNQIARQVRPVAIELANRKVAEALPDQPFQDAVRNLTLWDIGHVLIEQEYADLIHPSFYAQLAGWYLKGHFPCGWVGSFPDGQLIVY